METRIWAQQLDDTIIFTYTSGYSNNALPEGRRMRAVPTPWTRPSNPYDPPNGYVVPPRLRRPRHTNARMSVAGAAAFYSYETLEQQTLQQEENQDRGDGSGLSKECIFEHLIGTLSFSKTGEEICTICQDVIQSEEDMTTLRCSHVYHFRCIKEWLRVKNECAVCRALVISINGE